MASLLCWLCLTLVSSHILLLFKLCTCNSCMAVSSLMGANDMKNDSGINLTCQTLTYHGHSLSTHAGHIAWWSAVPSINCHPLPQFWSQEKICIKIEESLSHDHMWVILPLVGSNNAHPYWRGISLQQCWSSNMWIAPFCFFVEISCPWVTCSEAHSPHSKAM